MLANALGRVRMPASPQQGFALLEGLIAILIFSMGILAIVGLQAVAAKQVADARYRSEASLLANELIGAMWVSKLPPAGLQTNFSSQSSGSEESSSNNAFSAWMSKVNLTLPGAENKPPTVSVDNEGMVTVTLFWLPPGAEQGAREHQYVTVAHVRWEPTP